MTKTIHLRPVFIAVIEFSGVLIKLLLNKLFLIETTLPISPKGSPWPPRRLDSPAWFAKLAVWDQGPAGVGLQAWAYSPGLLWPFRTHRATEASNVKGPVYSGNPGKKGVSKK